MRLYSLCNVLFYICRCTQLFTCFIRLLVRRRKSRSGFTSVQEPVRYPIFICHTFTSVGLIYYSFRFLLLLAVPLLRRQNSPTSIKVAVALLPSEVLSLTPVFKLDFPCQFSPLKVSILRHPKAQFVIGKHYLLFMILPSTTHGRIPFIIVGIFTSSISLT